MEKMTEDYPKGNHIEAEGELLVDKHAEARLLRKLDIWLAPLMVLFFLVAYLDRSNIGTFGLSGISLVDSVGLTRDEGNAAIAGLTEDLHLHSGQLNVAVTLFHGMFKPLSARMYSDMKCQ